MNIPGIQDTCIFIRHTDHDFLYRLELFTVFPFLDNDLRLGDRQFITFSSHILNEYGKMEFSSSGNLERICSIRRFDQKTDVDLKLFLKPFFDMP